MNAQTPAEGVLLINEWGLSKMYKVVCQCSDEDCSHTIDIEGDDTSVIVTTYTTQKSNFWLMHRFQIIWTLLTKGYVEYQASIHMSKQQALNYAETLKSAINDVEEFRNKNNEQN